MGRERKRDGEREKERERKRERKRKDERGQTERWIQGVRDKEIHL